MAETLGVVFARRGHTTRPISDCCILMLGINLSRVKPGH